MATHRRLLALSCVAAVLALGLLAGCSRLASPAAVPTPEA